MRRIALLGSAPSSIGLAPLRNPDWEIWGCSPGAYGPVIAAGCTPAAWFELHRWEPDKPWFSPEYRAWMATLPLVWMAEVRPEIPGSRALPWRELVAEFGPYWFSSSLSWMLGMAMQAGATAIGMWGVDMSATEEWAQQRPACLRMIEHVVSRGIEFHLPTESDLMRPPPLYGVCEIDHAWIKLLARKAELETRMNEVAAQNTATLNEHMFLKGAVDDLNYMLGTWVGVGPSLAHLHGVSERRLLGGTGGVEVLAASLTPAMPTVPANGDARVP